MSLNPKASHRLIDFYKARAALLMAAQNLNYEENEVVRQRGDNVLHTPSIYDYSLGKDAVTVSASPDVCEPEPDTAMRMLQAISPSLEQRQQEDTLKAFMECHVKQFHCDTFNKILEDRANLKLGWAACRKVLRNTERQLFDMERQNTALRQEAQAVREKLQAEREKLQAELEQLNTECHKRSVEAVHNSVQLALYKAEVKRLQAERDQVRFLTGAADTKQLPLQLGRFDLDVPPVIKTVRLWVVRSEPNIWYDVAGTHLDIRIDHPCFMDPPSEASSPEPSEPSSAYEAAMSSFKGFTLDIDEDEEGDHAAP